MSPNRRFFIFISGLFAWTFKSESVEMLSLIFRLSLLKVFISSLRRLTCTTQLCVTQHWNLVSKCSDWRHCTPNPHTPLTWYSTYSITAVICSATAVAALENTTLLLLFYCNSPSTSQELTLIHEVSIFLTPYHTVGVNALFNDYNQTN